jgi:hypothetical protein
MLIPTQYKQFARNLVTSKELDPMYDFMDSARFLKGQEWVDKFALYLFMFYDARGAVNAANVEDFWFYVLDNYDTCRRGTERRHFRGIKGLGAILKFKSYGTPSDVWEMMMAPTFTGLEHRLKLRFSGCEIGPYFAWKAMDILDRSLGRPVDLTLREALKYLPDSPRKCCKNVFPGVTIDVVLCEVREWISDLDAPGEPNRKCGIQEAETILCAIDGLVKGSYRFGKDLDARHVQLDGLPERYMLPKQQDWILYEGY